MKKYHKKNQTLWIHIQTHTGLISRYADDMVMSLKYQTQCNISSTHHPCPIILNRVMFPC